MNELYKRYRPKTVDELVGQPEAVKVLKSFQNNGYPHAILLLGPSGCGKTTIGRIIKRELGCQGMDFEEINAAESRGIDMVRELDKRKGFVPMSGKARIWLIDEAQSLTRDAQSSLLKILEDTPKHAYYLLATTDPEKLLPTIKTRCTPIKVNPLNRDDTLLLLNRVLEKEGKKVGEEVLERITEAADGSARKALVLLDSVVNLDNDEDRIDTIQKSDHRKQAIELARTLLNPKAQWKDVAIILKGIEGEEPEGIRRLVLGYARTVLLKGGSTAPRAFEVLYHFEGNVFDSGHSGLARACWGVMDGK